MTRVPGKSVHEPHAQIGASLVGGHGAVRQTRLVQVLLQVFAYLAAVSTRWRGACHKQSTLSRVQLLGWRARPRDYLPHLRPAAALVVGGWHNRNSRGPRRWRIDPWFFGWRGHVARLADAGALRGGRRGHASGLVDWGHASSSAGALGWGSRGGILASGAGGLRRCREQFWWRRGRHLCRAAPALPPGGAGSPGGVGSPNDAARLGGRSARGEPCAPGTWSANAPDLRRSQNIRKPPLRD